MYMYNSLSKLFAKIVQVDGAWMQVRQRRAGKAYFITGLISTVKRSLVLATVVSSFVVEVLYLR